MFLNDVPKKKGEYEKFIEDIMPEEIFKLLTSPDYFNEVLNWKDRRKVLLRVAGEVSNDEIFSTNPKLKGLAVVLEKRKIEDFQKMQAEKKRKINSDIEMIPIRVDEIRKSMPEGSANIAGMKAEIADVEKEIEAAQLQISNIQNGNAIQTKKGEVIRIQNEMADLKRSVEDDSRNEVYKLKTKIQEEQGNLRILENKRDRLMQEMNVRQKDIESLTEKMNELRPKVIARKKEEYIKPESDSCDCPTCGQVLPADQVAAADEKALASFNLKKSEDVERMTNNGKAMKEDCENIKEQLSVYSQDLADISVQVAEKDKSLAKLSEQLKTAENDVKDVTENKQYKDLQTELAELKESIAGLEEGAAEAVAGIQDDINTLKAKRAELNSQIAVYANVPAQLARIAELEEQEEKLAAEFGQIEEHLYLVDEFIRAKVKVMEDKINSKFKLARFRLFKQQINGGVDETCETMVDSVEYSKGLNNAMKINVGIDIINTLSEFHGMQAPIFLDNSEAVVEPLHSDSQTIRLIVSGADKTLRVEQKEKAAV